MERILHSNTQTVTFGPGRMLVIIGEQINPNGRKKLRIDMAAGDFDWVRLTPRRRWQLARTRWT